MDKYISTLTMIEMETKKYKYLLINSFKIIFIK